MKIIGRRFDSNEIISLEIEDQTIVSTEPIAVPKADIPKIPWIAPAFLDVQVNGLLGQEFSSLELTTDRVEKILTEHYKFGVTALCPTLTTQSFEVISHGLKTIAKTCDQSFTATNLVAGIHVEGPYFSTEDGPRGAHPIEHCRAPDWDEFQRFQAASGGRIVILTMSPEYDNSAEFIKKVVRSGVIVSIGHTGANSEQIKAAVDAGASMSTHLGNGSHGTIRRHPNYIWDQMAEDRLVAGLIVDGHHLPASVVKSMVRAKTPERCVIVSDESGWAGLPPGTYAGSGGDIDILPDGRIVVSGQTQYLAGAALPIGDGVANVMKFAGVNLETAIQMVTVNPARLLGLPIPALRPGAAANIVLFDIKLKHEHIAGSGFELRANIKDGKLVAGYLE